ncbi:MAG: UDP-glucose 4-epimerase GalE [Gemmatimonadota bacterium]|nr:UDP-glucose 4-epimerase GalE [Gemmatimonadota bacterium]
MRILVTGGAGYIGSHTVLLLLQAGHQVVVVDNLSNSNPEALRRVAELAGRAATLHEVDILDHAAMDHAFTEAQPDAVIHFAGLKAVGESVREPMRYYRNNVAGTVALLEAMERHQVRTLLFSSSATVYGDPHAVPILEDFPLSATNPYGRSKLMIEEILRDLHRSAPEWSIGILRYFNPVGAHESGRIGEDPNGLPNNLLPYVTQVAVGRLPAVSVYGSDYPTPDGTGVRDYIHVVDLADGHLRALDYLLRGPGLLTCNLGTGKGVSVLEMIHAMERAAGKSIPCRLTERRPGDVALCYADPGRARQLLGWTASRDLDAMCADAWRWQRDNPDGYPSA